MARAGLVGYAPFEQRHARIAGGEAAGGGEHFIVERAVAHVGGELGHDDKRVGILRLGGEDLLAFFERTLDIAGVEVVAGLGGEFLKGRRRGFGGSERRGGEGVAGAGECDVGRRGGVAGYGGARQDRYERIEVGGDGGVGAHDDGFLMAVELVDDVAGGEERRAEIDAGDGWRGQLEGGVVASVEDEVAEGGAAAGLAEILQEPAVAGGADGAGLVGVGEVVAGFGDEVVGVVVADFFASLGEDFIEAGGGGEAVGEQHRAAGEGFKDAEIEVAVHGGVEAD